MIYTIKCCDCECFASFLYEKVFKFSEIQNCGYFLQGVAEKQRGEVSTKQAYYFSKIGLIKTQIKRKHMLDASKHSLKFLVLLEYRH